MLTPRQRTHSAQDEIESLRRRLATLQTERRTWESHWQEIAELMSPRKAGFTGRRQPGEKAMLAVYDSTAIHAVELLAAGLHGVATNPASKWFSLRMTDDALNDMDEVKQWLADVEQIMWARMYAPGTNFTTALHEIYHDLAAFGTGILFCGLRDSGGLLFEAKPLSQFYIAENAEGVVDTVYGRTEYAVRQLVELFGLEAVSDNVRRLYESGLHDSLVWVVHAVYPRPQRQASGRRRETMPFASVYYEEATAHVLEEGGFPEFPYMVPRWSKRSGELYGRSQGMTALPDTKMLQAMMLVTIKAAQKVADPPLFLPHEGFMGPIRTVPGGLNFYRGSRGEIFPMPVSTGLPVTFQMMEDVRNRIRTTFFADVIQFVTDVRMTATEVRQRAQERMRLLGPIVGRLEAELLGPLVSRVMQLLHRLGVLPPEPEVISGRDYTVEFVSPIATAQKQGEADALLHVVQYAMPLAQADPTVMARVFNLEEVVRYLADLFNLNPKLLTSAEDEELQRQQHQATQAVQQLGGPAAQIARQGAGAARDLAAASGAPLDFGALLAALPEAGEQLQALPGVVTPGASG